MGNAAPSNAVLKVGDHCIRLFSGDEVLETFLYEKLQKWTFTDDRVLLMTKKKGPDGKYVPAATYNFKTLEGEAISGAMHAEAVAIKTALKLKGGGKMGGGGAWESFVVTNPREIVVGGKESQPRPGKFELRVSDLGIELWSAGKQRKGIKYTSMHKWVKVNEGFKIVLLGEDGATGTQLLYTTTAGEAIGRAMVKQAYKVACKAVDNNIVALAKLVSDECVDFVLGHIIEPEFTNKYYRVLSNAAVRKSPELNSPRHQTLKAGMVVFATAYAINSTGLDRVHIVSEDREDRLGWVSPFSHQHNHQNQPILQACDKPKRGTVKCAAPVGADGEPAAVDTVLGEYKTISYATCREGPEMASPVSTTLNPGEVITITATQDLPDGTVRMKSMMGWVSLKDHLLEKLVIDPAEVANRLRKTTGKAARRMSVVERSQASAQVATDLGGASPGTQTQHTTLVVLHEPVS